MYVNHIHIGYFTDAPADRALIIWPLWSSVTCWFEPGLMWQNIPWSDIYLSTIIDFAIAFIQWYPFNISGCTHCLNWRSDLYYLTIQYVLITCWSFVIMYCQYMPSLVGHNIDIVTVRTKQEALLYVLLYYKYEMDQHHLDITWGQGKSWEIVMQKVIAQDLSSLT